ncbi:ADP-ribosylation/crystallin J1 [Xanthomonas phaseoli pv. syngonii LMG 9055]|uniref:ADP-ribosylation/crystallin J1 n=1 Tax=Xanthomonas phaseoli pv. syngonii LMG 9055 TaxID=1437878 RepID=A0A1V9HFQ0_9XANT|nr:ADP-ribosylation/crystallin J1 [Xanthomonas phaseoli pv. syngonii LMG 9055]
MRQAARSSEVTTAQATVTMYRPLGPEEYALVRDSGFRRWPPRLPEQPIFYPVTNQRYAEEIASRWNVKDSGVGYVAQFEVRAAFVEQYAIQKVGGAHHTEWWIPAEELYVLNDNIVGLIDIIGQYDAPPAEHTA